MIALLLSLLAAPAPVVEMVDSSAQEVSIQALIRLPKLGAKDLAKLDILVRAIPKQTEDYPRREMLTVTSGQPVHGDVTPDHIRLVVNVQATNMKAGLSLMESLLHKATLTQENLDSAALSSSDSDYWGAALNPTILPNVKLGQDEALVLYHRVFRPENLLIAVGGKIIPGEAQNAWEHRMDSWTAEAMPKGYFDISKIQPLTKNPGPVSTIDLAGAPILSGDAALSTKILALFALGTGKGASLFRTVREKHGWSYRQEAILSPTMDGWMPHLLFASIPSDDMAQRAETIKSDLLEDIKAWTEADRTRALGMADAVLTRGLSFSPLYVLGTSPVGASLEDRTYMAGYWQMKTGQPWDPARLLDSMRHVALDDLKAQAIDIVSSTHPQILPAG